MLLGSRAYKRYYAEQFSSSRCYVSKYIVMEFRRSFLINAIAFYFTLDLPTIETIGDALNYWSERYKKSELKAILQFVAKLCETHKLNTSKRQDKSKARRAIASAIQRLEMKLRGMFVIVGQDSTRCARALVPFPLDVRPNSIDHGFTRFVEGFSDVQTCRNRCSIDKFFLHRYRPQVESYRQISNGLSNNNNTRGFKKIADVLSEILERDGNPCSCKTCEQIGDAVIALDAPRDMRLDHTDNSFDYLCPPIHQPHQKHPSQTKVLQS